MRLGFLRLTALFAGMCLSLATPAFATEALSASSANFDVQSYRGGPAVAEILNRCESLRGECRRVWLDLQDEAAWNPRCSVVLHATRAGYLQAVGRGGSQTSGSSLVRFERDRVVLRRVDLVVARDGTITALAHELTHVVLADRFGPRRPPLWLDEGIATLADAAAKQSLHDRDCRRAMENGSALRLIELLRLEAFDSAEQIPAFYGQSLSLVRFLAERDPPAKTVIFAERAMHVGHDRALAEHYNIGGLAALEREWRDYAAANGRPHDGTRAVRASLRK